jgi:uncharacterized lipoprotein YmbA
MRVRLPVLACGAAAALGLLGCVSLKRTPEARFFALRSILEPSEGPAAAADPGALVGLLPVLVPGHLERPQLVTWAGPGELRIDEYLRWAEPLDTGIARTIAEDLDALLPANPVVRPPWPAAIVPFCRVRVELRVFGPQESGDVLLEGRWALLPRGSDRPIVHRSTSLRRARPARPAGDAGASVEAMSALLADLAREIAAAIVALPVEPEDAARVPPGPQTD